MGVDAKAHGSVSRAQAVLIPASVGELVDKITILEIKKERISEPGKLAYVHEALEQLEGAWVKAGLDASLCGGQKAELKTINGRLWQIEDKLRAFERAGDFGGRFVSLARSVYRLNDRRAAVKREIDTLFGSVMREVKSYEPY